MEQNRCIFCMNEIKGQDQICPACKKGIWEYRWKEDYLEPYTMLQEKYLVGAALEETGEMIRYTGYDTVLDQKVFLYAYDVEIWKAEKEKDAENLFGRFDFSGMTAVKDYFSEQDKGFIVTSFAEGAVLPEYLKVQGRVPEEKTVEMLLPVIRAVNALHASGLIHGNITPSHLIVTEEETLCLLADCRSVKSAEKAEENQKKTAAEAGIPYRALEQFDEKGIFGPWTDIYSLGAVWYEMLTGHRPEDSVSRKKKDTLRTPSRYTEISQKTEKALLQALSLEPQTRFFYLGNLLESMGIPFDELEKDAGAIRNFWGEAWLEIAVRTREQQKKRRIKGYVWKRIAAAGAGALCLAAAGSAGIYAYIQTHQPEYFQWKLEQAQKKVDIHSDQGIFRKDDPEYEQVKDFILKYGEPETDAEESSERRNIYYDLEEKDLKYCPVKHSAEESFYLDYPVVKNMVQYYMDISGKMDLAQEDFYVTGCIDQNEEAAVALFSHNETTYKVRSLGEKIKFTYDVLDERLTGIQFQGSRKRCARFLEKMIPFLAPETYLTGEEAEELMETVPEEDDYVSLGISAKHEIHISHRDDYQEGDGEIYEVEIGPQGLTLQDWYGYYLDYGEDETIYAGNYERGSERYEEFTSYVKEHALSEKKTETKEDSIRLDSRDGTVYTLEEEDVLKWGEPCNNFRFFIKAGEIIEGLKEKGYEMKKISEKRENTVEIQKYGAILTNYNIVERYEMKENVYLAIVKDLVNEDVMQMLVYRKAGSGAQIQQEAADVGILAGEFKPEEKEELAADILDAQKAAGEEEDKTYFLVVENVMFMNSEYEDTGIATHIIPAAKFNGQSYYWP